MVISKISGVSVECEEMLTLSSSSVDHLEMEVLATIFFLFVLKSFLANFKASFQELSASTENDAVERIPGLCGTCVAL